MTKIAGLLQKTTKFLKIIFWMEDYEAERGFLTTKGADGERKSVKENAPGRVEARLGACVYRFVMVKITQGTASACPPAPPPQKRRGGIRAIAPPKLTWALFLRNFVTPRDWFSR